MDNSAMGTIDLINKLWFLLAFIGGVIWKQISMHFDVASLKTNQLKLEEKADTLENEFNSALKEHIIENKVSNEKLTEAITELIKTTTILAVKFENLERNERI